MARTRASRQPILQQITYLKTRKITFADDGVAVYFDGQIPAGSLIIKPLSGFQVNVAFDGSGVIDIGPTSNDDLWMTDGSGATVTFVPLDEAVTMYVDADTQPICTMSGGTVTTGEGYGVIAYIKV